MKISKEGISLIQSFEGYRSKAYKDSKGLWTIGWGSTKIFNREVLPSDEVTPEQAEEQFQKDIVRFENAVNKLVKSNLTQKQFDALVSFVYNIGEYAFKNSYLLVKLNIGEYYSIPRELIQWCHSEINNKMVKVKGLLIRRLKEATLFAEGIQT